MSRFWSKNVSNLTPYIPGEQPQIANLIKLNTNENPYGPSPKVIRAIADATTAELRKYPDPNAAALKQSIADYYAVQRDQVFVGNSSDEVLGHTFQALLKHDAPLLFPDITYSFYPVYCGLFGIDYQTVALRSDFRIDISGFSQPNGGIIFANPNAPTGIVLDLDKVEALLQKNSESVLVVDEAYVDFAQPQQSAIRLIDLYPNLLVIQTLSKARSLAGLRVGLACGNADLIEALERVKNSFHPYALSRLAIAGATAAFEDTAYFTETCDKVVATRERITQQLQKLEFDVLPSSANFVLAKHAHKPAVEVFQQLRDHGIIIRYFDKPRINEYVRISIGTDAEMDSLIAALKKIVAN